MDFSDDTQQEHIVEAINYCLGRWDAFSRFLDDGRLCMSTDGVEKPCRQFKATFFGFSFQAATIRSYACSTRAT
ncbi:IS66 family transposase [Bradyrhizobium huanghuaihaiense]|uniref:IS66 family transposase n=1 Tax=Bradyrhizobium huanghuaihaiense TaxID=990078 RepID=UPI0021AA47BD|nr:IS66 family transposase [Bradyrhizobium sp. CB3035]UWU75766.1 IS66 family transposase [Bradyrhizobium sp. CB3035]